MKVLVACEESQTVTIAFRERGHEAYSCDIQPCSGGHPEWHFQQDVLPLLNQDWDLMIAHPPCTYLAVSGAAWFDSPLYPNRRKDQKDSIEFFMKLAYAPIDKIAIENPVGIMSTHWRQPTQIIQPWMFGDEAQKTTCLWLKNIPKLRYGHEVQMALGEITPPQTKITGKGEFITHASGKTKPKWFADALSLPKEERQKARSKTFQGIANAMAEQWGI